MKNDQGTVQYDQIQVEFCHIVSPITGRVGLRLVDPGNVVTANGSTVLAVVTQIQPITVVFTVAEDSLGQIVPQLRKRAKLTGRCVRSERSEEDCVGNAADAGQPDRYHDRER